MQNSRRGLPEKGLSNFLREDERSSVRRILAFVWEALEFLKMRSFLLFQITKMVVKKLKKYLALPTYHNCGTSGAKSLREKGEYHTSL